MNLNIRDCPDELGKAVRVAAANAGISIRGWVIQVLEEAVLDGGTGRRGAPRESGDSGSRRDKSLSMKETPRDAKAPSPNAGSSPAPATKLIPGQKCSICGAGVYEAAAKDSSGKKWKCVGPRVHTMSPRGAE